MELCYSKIKDLERLQRYERVMRAILANEGFSKTDIWRCGEGKRLIGMIINILLSEGAIAKKSKTDYKWIESKRERYKKEWQRPSASSHQLIFIYKKGLTKIDNLFPLKKHFI
jgi:hypothetical protein